jgi:hypothetical protein
MVDEVINDLAYFLFANKPNKLIKRCKREVKGDDRKI